VAVVAAFSAAAQPRSQGGRRELRHRTITIDDQSLMSLPEIHVAGGAATVITFPVPMKEGGALLIDVKGVFFPPSQAERTVILVPKTDLESPAALNVSLADGTVLSFKLVTLPGESDVQVDVAVALSKRAAPNSAQALRALIDQLRADLDECQATSASAGAAKLASLILAQNVDEPQVFDRRPLRAGEKQNRILVHARWVYRLVGYTYLVFTVENRDPGSPWVLDRADVRLGSGNDSTDLKVIATTAEMAALPSDASERVVVAFQAPGEVGSRQLTVTLHEKGGGRRVVLAGLSP
jgi:uncharacterized protein (TIGR02268 family)